MKKSFIAFKKGLKIEPMYIRDIERALEPFEEGTKLTITVENYVRKRSLGQGNLFHMLCGFIAKEIGHTKDEIKEYLKMTYGVQEPLIGRDGIEIADKETGEIMMKPKSTSAYSKQEMAELIEATYEFASGLGIILPTPEDLKNYNIPL